MDTDNINLTPEGIEHSQRPFRDALSSVPGGRAYAIDQSDLAPLSFWIAYSENRGISPSTREVGKYLKDRVSPYAPGLYQLRATTEPKLPALPKIGGYEVANAFLHDDRESQNAWLARDPEAAAFWKEAAQKGGGKPTFKQLVEYEKKLAAAREIASIAYTAAEHRQNPFLTNDRDGQNELMRTDPRRFAIYRWEAENSPIKFVWSMTSGNLTAINRALAGDEEVGRLLLRARDIHRDLLQRQRDEAEKSIAAARALLHQTSSAAPPPKPFAGRLR